MESNLNLIDRILKEQKQGDDIERTLTGIAIEYGRDYKRLKAELRRLSSLKKIQLEHFGLASVRWLYVG
jgi:predicted transcriptional regulator